MLFFSQFSGGACSLFPLRTRTFGAFTCACLLPPVHQNTDVVTFDTDSGGRQVGESPVEKGMGGIREAGEEGAGIGIPKEEGSGKFQTPLYPSRA